MGRIIPARRPFTTTVEGRTQKGQIKTSKLEDGRLLAITNTGISTIDGSKFTTAKFGLSSGEARRVIGYAENADYLLGLELGSVVDAYVDQTSFGSFRLAEVLKTVAPAVVAPVAVEAAEETAQETQI
jgi:hypothetical protein